MVVVVVVVEGDGVYEGVDDGEGRGLGVSLGKFHYLGEMAHIALALSY